MLVFIIPQVATPANITILKKGVIIKINPFLAGFNYTWTMNDFINVELKELIKKSYNNSEYYKSKFDELNINLDKINTTDDFASLPVLTRELLANNFEMILDTQYRHIKRNMLEQIQTSGSTGKIMEVLWKREELVKSNVYLWRKRQEWYGINTKSRKCEFVTSTIAGKSKYFNRNDAINESDNILSLSTIYFGDDILEEYYNRIKVFKPEWIYAPVSVLLKFVYFLKHNCYPKFKTLKYVELYGEQVTNAALNYLKDYFDIEIAIMYGCKEINGIALTCPNNTMHILEKNVYVECDENDDAIVTSRTNTIFPLIRYKLGDKIKLSSCKCECGTKGAIIKKIIGREADLSFVDASTGITVNSLLNSVFVVNSILDYPFIQYKIERNKHFFQIYLYVKNEFLNWKDTIVNEFYKCFDSYGIPQNIVQIIFCDMPIQFDSKTSKLKLFEGEK